MNTFVTTTFFIIIVFSLINMLTSVTIYFTSRNFLYLRTGLFWLFLIFNFIIQSQVQYDDFSIILGYGFTIIPLNLLSYATLYFCECRYPIQTLLPLSVLSVLTTFLLKDTSLPFTVKALPFAITAAAPLFFTVYIITIKKRYKSTPLLYIHAFALFLLAVHSLNFAIFRMKPEAQLWGWPIAYGLYQLLAVIIPALTLDFNHRGEQARLRNIISDRTKDLVEANRDLERLLQQKRFLLRTLTHDIVNPLTVIHTKLKLANGNGYNKETFLKSMNSMTNRIISLINQVRNFDKIDQIKSELKIKEYNLLDCVHEIEEIFENRLQDKKIQLLYDSQAMQNCKVLVDHDTFINSILSNIFSNAIKFSHPNSAISLSVFAESPGYVIFSVRDSGIGMSKSTQEKLFEFETNSSRRGTDGEVGTGFGMPILSKIVHAYGGKIKITSEEQAESKPGYTDVQLTLAGNFVSLNNSEVKFS